MSDQARQFRSESAAWVVEIDHKKAFADLAYAVFASEPPAGGWPPDIEEKLAVCREASARLRDVMRTLDRSRNR